MAGALATDGRRVVTDALFVAPEQAGKGLGQVVLQRLLALEPGSLLRLLNRPPPWLQKEDVKELRKSTEEFALIINDLTALGERIKLL